MNRLYFGDNLEVLRQHVADASVDLIYLDPPFNSNASYNILFKAPDGSGADASIEAFDDTWSWGPAASSALMDIAESGHHALHTLVQAMRVAIGENAMMAYLAMMAVRLVELHRALKPTGSLYLHCDPTASHYLKLVLDAVFGGANFRNEVVWDYSFRLMDLPRFFNRKHDVILFYAKSDKTFFKMPKTVWTREALEQSRKQRIHVDDNGVEWIWMPGGRGNSKSKMRRVDEIIAGGKAVSDVWSMPVISSSSHERLGYPTQKPIALLERIVGASSRPGDVVLDPFCGCGTAVDAAQKLGRRWIGIDVTHLAVGLIEKRLREGYGEAAMFETVGVPRDLASAQRLARDDPHQFQHWITLKIGGWPWMGGRKGADRGVDGYFYYVDRGGGTATGVISVKAGTNVNPAMVRDLGRVMQRDRHALGLFLCAALPTRGMEEEAASHGLVETEFGRFPALQIFTLAEMFQGHHPRLPPLVSANRRARRVETRASHLAGAQGDLI